MFPTPQQDPKAIDEQARDMVQVLAMAGFNHWQAMRLCGKMRLIVMEMRPEQFDALKSGK